MRCGSPLTTSTLTLSSQDDCWAKGRYANGTVYADPKYFPSGTLKVVADYAHERGFLFGSVAAAHALAANRSCVHPPSLRCCDDAILTGCVLQMLPERTPIEAQRRVAGARELSAMRRLTRRFHAACGSSTLLDTPRVSHHEFLAPLPPPHRPPRHHRHMQTGALTTSRSTTRHPRPTRLGSDSG